MKLPKMGQIATEAMIVIGGAILAAAIVGQFPALRKWIKEQWSENA